MVFIELLKSQGLSEEQLNVIIKEMKKSKVFITYEEKIEERYQKMKLQRDQLKDKLKLAEAALEKLNEIFQTDKGKTVTDKNKP